MVGRTHNAIPMAAKSSADPDARQSSCDDTRQAIELLSFRVATPLASQAERILTSRSQGRSVLRA